MKIYIYRERKRNLTIVDEKCATVCEIHCSNRIVGDFHRNLSLSIAEL